MAFGAKATTGNATYDTTNGDKKDVFFPNASGLNGATKKYVMRLFADEDEVIFREWAGQVNVRGTQTFRSCVVAQDNIFDNANRVRKAEVDTMDIGEDEKKALLKELKWTSNKFALNVYNREAGLVQIFKGSYKKLEVDKFGNPVSANNNSMYAKLWDIQGSSVVPSKDNPRVPAKQDIWEHDINFICKGQGQFGKTYGFEVGFDREPTGDTILALPRWNIEGWVRDKGVWSNDALQELMDGADYYETVTKYGIQLYAELREETAPEVENEEEALF